MRNICTIPIATAAAALMTGCAAYDDDPGYSSGARECFLPSQVSGYNNAPDSAEGREQIYVSTGPRDTYLFEMFGPCPELDFSEAIGFDTRGSTRICSGLDVTLVVPGSIGPQRCPVRMVRKLSDAEKAAR